MKRREKTTGAGDRRRRTRTGKEKPAITDELKATRPKRRD